MIAFLNLSRKLELVVARAAGVSVWQFLTPPLAVIVLIGVVLRHRLQSSIDLDEREIGPDREQRLRRPPAVGAIGCGSGRRASTARRSSTPPARSAGGAEFKGVEMFNFDDQGNFVERVDAASGELHDGYWELHDAKVVTPGFETLRVSTYLLATNLDRREVAQAFVAPETVSFWRLPALAEQTARAGSRPDRLSLEISGASGPPADAGGDGAGGRLLFVKILPNGRRRDYGFRWRRGRVRALCGDQSDQRSRRGRLHQRSVAGWSPGIVGCLFGVYVLLHQEDG